MPIRGSSHFPFFKTGKPQVPPKPIDKAKISGPSNPVQTGGVVNEIHGPMHQRVRNMPAAGPAPAAQPADDRNFDHMRSSTAGGESPLTRDGSLGSDAGRGTVPWLNAGASGTVPWLNRTPERGTVPWLNRSPEASAADPNARPAGRPFIDLSAPPQPSHTPIPRREPAPERPLPASDSVSQRELRQAGQFWNGLDAMIDRRLGPGDDHNMADLLRATGGRDLRGPGGNEFAGLLMQHPAAGGAPREPAPPLQQRMREPEPPPVPPKDDKYRQDGPRFLFDKDIKMIDLPGGEGL